MLNVPSKIWAAGNKIVASNIKWEQRFGPCFLDGSKLKFLRLRRLVEAYLPRQCLIGGLYTSASAS